MSERLSSRDGYYLSSEEARFARSAILSQIAQAQQLAERLGADASEQVRVQPVNLPVMERRHEVAESSAPALEIERGQVPVGIVDDNGVWREVDLSQWPDDDPIHTLVQPNPSASSATTVRGKMAASFSASAHELKQERRHRPVVTRRNIAVAALVAVAGTTGGGFALHGGGVPNVFAAMGMFQSSPYDHLTVGACLDDTGAGDTLGSAVVGAQADMAWQIHTLDGRSVTLKQGTTMPHLTIPEANLGYTACLPENAHASALTVDGTKITVHLDKLTPEATLTINSKNVPQSEAWPLEAKAGVTDAKVIADLVGAMKDQANTDLAVATAKQQVVAAINQSPDQLQKIELSLQRKLEAAIETEAKRAASSASPTVVFEGAWQPLTYKGTTPAASDKFNVINTTLTQLDVK